MLYINEFLAFSGLKQTGAGSMGRAADPVMPFDRLTAPA